MIIVKLMGGLGNQMFQYALARRMAYITGQPLKLDIGWFGNIPKGATPRTFELGVFNCIQEVASRREVRALQGVDTKGWPKVAKRFLKRTRWLVRESYIRETGFSFDSELLTRQGDLYLDGYWQSPHYFSDVEETIRTDFIIHVKPDPVNREAAREIELCDSVALHVRRGDYVTNATSIQHHANCSLEYYRAAVTKMQKRVAAPHFFVFSDDPEWVRRNLQISAPTTYFSHNGPDKAYEDLRLMSLCRHHIIANSSFSWWGAWLGNSESQTVIGPSRWFNALDIDTSDLFPTHWIRV